MVLFPFFEDIKDKNILIVGGGKVAEEKFFRLYQFSHRIKIVTKELLFAPPKNVDVLLKEFEAEDLERIHICIAATNNRETNQKIHDLCHGKGIRVNVVDDPKLCDFIFPSLVKKGDLVMGISTAGKAPAIASLLREKLEEALPEATEDIMESLGSIRPYLVKKIPNHKLRGAVMKKLFSAMLLENRSFSKSECRAFVDLYMEEENE